MDVKQQLIDVLEAFDFPVFLQGSLQEDEPYPDSFFTFWNNDTEDASFFDNNETRTIWNFDVNFYSCEPALVNTMLREAKKSLKAANFIVQGVGYDVVSDEPTHTGRGVEVIYIERTV